MRTLKVTTLTGKVGVLTTNHAASSYGMPVLVVDGVAYGPGDMLGRECALVADHKPARKTLVIDIAAALEGPAQSPVVAAWNKRVVAVVTAGKHWSDEAGRYVADQETL